MLDFLKEHFSSIWPFALLLIGWVLPTPKFKLFGKQIGEQIPPKLAKMIAERLRALESGLLAANFKGDINLVDNDTIKNELKKTKLDLDLKE